MDTTGVLAHRGGFLVERPEVGFPEAVVAVELPDRGTVERPDFPLWTAGSGGGSLSHG
ncbi:hypothetical protein ACFFQW_34890 [Umezawaea endophytica]|uniref:Uncharacterized protein n=1 Tax=Umezawaea endophytica TaxID=1654476 RepID=A0A9X2VUH3_9PSEU|nr:hypothetical protein [Umezawaea endophytica]MCS7481853.1 hypothetical protein [Umezawaea endophytica]